MNLYSPANLKPLLVDKNCRQRLRYKCIIGCPFIILISVDGKVLGFKVKILKINHNYEDTFKKFRVCTTTLAQYFKSKMLNNFKYMLKDIRQDLKISST